MAVKLNLLPEEFMLTGPLAKVVKVVRPLNIILLALFLVTAISVGAFFIFSSISLKNLQTANDDLISKIKSQSAAQQQIILLKDRLSKIKTVQAFPSAIKNLSNVDPLLSPLSSKTLLSELDVDSQKTTASVVFTSNTDLTDFISSLRKSTTFSLLSIGSFNYSQSTGYQLGITFIGK